jgi:hypothetical protein
MTDGKKVTHHTKYPPGTRENPLSTEGVVAKTRDLMGPVLGVEKTNKLIDQINYMEKLADLRKLRQLVAV